MFYNEISLIKLDQTLAKLKINIVYPSKYKVSSACVAPGNPNVSACRDSFKKLKKASTENLILLISIVLVHSHLQKYFEKLYLK